MLKRLLSLVLTLALFLSVHVTAGLSVSAATVPVNFTRITLMAGTRDVFINGVMEADRISAAPVVVDGVFMAPPDAVALALGIEFQSAEAMVPIMEVAASNNVANVFFCAYVEAVVVISGAIVSTARITHTALNTQSEAWHGGGESLRVAENLLVYQRDSGGWAQWANPPQYVAVLADMIRAQQIAQKGANDASLDNNNMIAEMRFLVRMYQATGIPQYKTAYMAAINAILTAQYPNGGLPQMLNQPSTYHGEITFNDNVMTNVMNFWMEIVRNENNAYHSVGDEMRVIIRESWDRMLKLILDVQIYSEAQGQLTAWAQQYHRTTLQPAWGRNYEPPSAASGESSRMVQFLMTLNPVTDVLDDETWERVKNAIHNASAFFAYSEMIGFTTQGNDRSLVETPDPLSAALWPRFICPETFLPLFAENNVILNNSMDRDEMDMIASYSGISQSRRGSYHFFGASPYHMRVWQNNVNGLFPERYGLWLEANDEAPYWESIMPFVLHGIPEVNPGETVDLNDYATRKNPHNRHNLWDIHWAVVDAGTTGAVIGADNILTTSGDGWLVVSVTCDLTRFNPIRTVIGQEIRIQVGDPPPEPIPTTEPSEPANTDASAGSDTSGDDDGGTVGIIVAVAVVGGVLVIGGVVLVVMKKRKA
jgi:PelA/Pel-15E family pectate lyase